MSKNFHEIRDPIHIFVRLDSHERKVLDSRPFQRLRHIHQLAMTYLVYPGATHRRFEHSLGVMELASRVFDAITNRDNVSDQIRDLIPEISSPRDLSYWKLVLRMAALCHDIGHLPFSHAAEKELLPDGYSHEQLTRDLIFSDEMEKIWNEITPPLRADDIVKLALGPKDASDLTFTDWESILAEIIVGNAFGADRMDYLLRDSYHTGVAYGRFDHYRLVDSLRILPPAGAGEEDASIEPALGVDLGGIQSAEALMLARYFMFSQVYFHPVRRIYDIHLMDFLKKWLTSGKFSTNLEAHLSLTDNEVTSEFLKAGMDESNPAHEPASHIIKRTHFKLVYQRNPTDTRINISAAQCIYKKVCEQFGEEFIRYDSIPEKGNAPDFPVRLGDNRIASSLAVSTVLQHLPSLAIDYIFVDRNIYKDVENWINENREEIIKPIHGDQDDE